MRFRMIAFGLFLVSSSGYGATVVRVLSETHRAVFQLDDSEILTVKDGETIKLKGSDAHLITGQVIKTTENRALVKVTSGFNVIKRGSNYSLVTQDVAAVQTTNKAQTFSQASASPGPDFQLASGSPSAFANEYDGLQDSPYIVRVPKWQANATYLHTVQGDVTKKNKDAGINTTSDIGGNTYQVKAVAHLFEKVWVGAKVLQQELQTKLKDKDTGAKTKGERTYQDIGLNVAFLASERVGFSLDLDAVSIDTKVTKAGLSNDDSASFNRARPSLMYFGDGYDLIISHRGSINIEEDVTDYEDPAALEVDAEVRLSQSTSARVFAAYVWYNRVDQAYKNSIASSLGMVFRSAPARMEADVSLVPSHYRDGGEDTSSVRTFQLTLGYFHAIDSNIEALGRIIYANANGGSDTKIDGSETRILIGANYKG